MKRNHRGRPLREIVDDVESLQRECREWFDNNVAERLAACESAEATRDIVSELSRECMSVDRQVRDIPHEIRFPIIVKALAFLDETEEQPNA